MKVKECYTYVQFANESVKYCGVCWRLSPQLSGTQVNSSTCSTCVLLGTYNSDLIHIMFNISSQE